MGSYEKRNSEEIGKLWERLVALELKNIDQVEKLDTTSEEVKEISDKILQPSDCQKTAQTASRSAVSHRTNITKIKDQILEVLEEVNKAKQKIINEESNIEEVVSRVNSSEKQIDLDRSEIASKHDEISDLYNSSNNKYDLLDEKFKSFENLFAELETLKEDCESSQETIDSIESINTKVQSLSKLANNYYINIRQSRNEILGYYLDAEEGDDEDDDSQREYVEGLKDQLENTFSELERLFKNLKDEFSTTKESYNSDYTDLLSSHQEKTESIVDKFTSQYNAAHKQITDLFPAALTTGLGAAYGEKIETENAELEKHQSTFTKAIRTLIIISLIPLCVDIYLLFGLDKDLLGVITETPKLILAILPLYFPVLWIAYSSNKKQKLSKRLVEEYTHKGVLSRTFEGLAKQIDNSNASDSEVTHNLREKLLFNLLDANSENPGKLISDYKTTDHPLMDAIDKSLKLGDAVDKLNNIPGFSGIVKRLEKKSNDLTKELENKANEALSFNNESKEKTE